MSTASKKRFLVYLASNAKGLDLERYEIQRVMARLGMFDIGLIYREDASPYNWDLIRGQIECADLFILLLGDDYGPMTPTGISYLHREYVHAKSVNKPTLAYIKNRMPGLPDNEDARRLAGFQRIVMQQSPYRMWHLRDELLQHVRTNLTSNVLNIGAGWLPVDTKQDAPVLMPAPSALPKSEAEKLSARQRQIKSQQLLNLEVSAKVYQGGNLTPTTVSVPARLDQMFKVLNPLLQQGASEDRVKAQIEKIISPVVSKQLLDQHAQAHAVDDVRISRTQLQNMLLAWQELGFIQKQLSGTRTLWSLTSFQ